MSKKLIAVASAAALALAGLVAIPTVATAALGPFSVTASGSQATNQVLRDGTTSAKALQVAVPSADVLRFATEAGTTVATNVLGTAIKLVIVTPGTTDAITVTATGGAEVLTDTQFDDASTVATTATGVTALADTAADGTATIYAYTTSTATGTIVVSAAGSSRTIYLAGLSTWGYKVAFASPATAALSGEFTISGKVKDAFGNDLTTALSVADVTTDWTFALVGATQGAAAYDATTKVYSFKFTAPAVATGTAISLSIDALKQSTSVTAFGAPVNSQFFTVSAVDLATQVTALTAQVAALTADYNALATRWNKKVDSKRRVFNKVPLK
jgi:hypothetical protein